MTCGLRGGDAINYTKQTDSPNLRDFDSYGGERVTVGETQGRECVIFVADDRNHFKTQ